jgi:hypothetical protein
MIFLGFYLNKRGETMGLSVKGGTPMDITATSWNLQQHGNKKARSVELVMSLHLTSVEQPNLQLLKVLKQASILH